MTKEIKWNACHKGDGWMARILERIYGNTGAAVFAPLAVCAVMMLLYLIFGEAPDKMEQLRVSLITMAFSYFGILLVLGTQLINPMCKPRFMDFVVLFVTAIYGLHTVVGLFQLLFHLKGGFDPGYAVSCGIISAIALIQSRRT